MAQYPTSAATNDNLYVQVNNKTTFLTADISNVDTTLFVSSTTGFPATGFVTVDLEIIAYTGLTATSFTGCIRGQDGTTAVAHLTNALVSHNIIAAHHNASKDEIIAVETDLVAVQSSLTDLAPADTASSILTRIRQIVTQIKAITGTTNWYDAVGRTIASLVSLLGNSVTQILTPSGSAAAPSHSFSADSDTGIYNSATDEISVSLGTSQTHIFTTNQVKTPSGAAATPTFSFTGDPNTGLYNSNTDQLSFSLGGVQAYIFTTTQQQGPTGAAATPTYSFTGDTNTGLYNSNTDQVSIALGGSQEYIFTGDQLQGQDGTVSVPAISFIADTDTGIYRAGANDMRLVAAGADKLTVSTTLAAAVALSMGSNKITSLANGTASTDAAAFGQLKVIQITTGTSTTTFNTTSSTFQTTNLSATITPTSSSNKVLIFAAAEVQNANGALTTAQITLSRGGTNILGTTGQQESTTGAVGASRMPCMLVYVDSPASTSALTYAVALASTDNATTVSFGAGSETQFMVLVEVVA